MRKWNNGRQNIWQRSGTKCSERQQIRRDREGSTSVACHTKLRVYERQMQPTATYVYLFRSVYKHCPMGETGPAGMSDIDTKNIHTHGERNEGEHEAGPVRLTLVERTAWRTWLVFVCMQTWVWSQTTLTLMHCACICTYCIYVESFLNIHTESLLTCIALLMEWFQKQWLARRSFLPSITTK